MPLLSSIPWCKKVKNATQIKGGSCLKGEVQENEFHIWLGFVVLNVVVFPVSSSWFARKKTGRRSLGGMTRSKDEVDVKDSYESDKTYPVYLSRNNFPSSSSTLFGHAPEPEFPVIFGSK